MDPRRLRRGLRGADRPHGQLDGAADPVERARERVAVLGHGLHRRRLVRDDGAVADREQRALLHQRLQQRLPAPQRLGVGLALGRRGAQHGEPVERDGPHRRLGHQRAVGDRDQLDHGASSVRGRSLLRCAVVDRAHERAQGDVDEVDVGDRQRDLARDHDAAAEQAVDEVHERDVALREGARAHDPSGTNEYGGNGPPSSIRAPDGVRRSASSPTRASMPPAGPRSTR